MAQVVVYELRKLYDVPALGEGEGLVISDGVLTAVPIATLDDSGKVPSSQLPAIAITNTYTVASQAAMLVLDAHLGDIAIRTDLGQTFILGANDATVLSNWHELEFTSSVTSVAGKTGTVALVEADIQNLVADLAAKETPAGAQAKADAAQSAATTAAASDATTKANAAATAAETYTDTQISAEETARAAADAAHASASPAHAASAVSVADAAGFYTSTDVEGALAELGPAVSGSQTALFNVKSYGAVGDAQSISDAAMTNGQKTVTSATGKFAAGDVGKRIFLGGAGAAGASLGSTVTAYISATQVTIADAASTDASVQAAVWGTDDRAAIQTAIEACHAAGQGTVYFPMAGYLLATAGGTFTLPGDDGTVKATYGSTLPPETPGPMSYCLLTYSNVKLLGDSLAGTRLFGPWIYGSSPVDTNQLVGIVYGDYASAPQDLVFENFKLLKFFIPILGMGGTVTTDFKNLQFRDCAFTTVLQSAEFVTYDNVRALDTACGPVHGGWWTYRNNSFTSSDMPHAWSSGYTDKTAIRRLKYQNSRTHTAYEDSIDAFFDTYFFKTANNGTRGSTPIMSQGDVLTLAPYMGLTGSACTFHSRYGRPNYNDSQRDWFVYGAERYIINAGIPYDHECEVIYGERIGYYDKNAYSSSKIFGVNYTNPYLGTRPQAAFYGVNGLANQYSELNLDPIAAVTLINVGSFSWRNLQFNTTDVTSAMGLSRASAAVRLPNVSDANLAVLDFYQEGTFTPVVKGTSTVGAGTYTLQTGNYTRIGNRVFFTIWVIWTAHTGTGNLRIDGLPYTNPSASPISPLAVYSVSGVAFTGPHLTGYVEQNATSLVIRQDDTTGAGTAVALPAAASLVISGSYGVAT